MQKFIIQVPDKAIEYLHHRLDTTRWMNPPFENDWKKGVPIDYLKKLAAYWRNEFDWKQQEAFLNKYPQFITEIEGQPIHFLHIKSPTKNAVPLLLIHGWPGSFADFSEVIEPLTAPQTADQIAFDLVIPSVPGFGFSIPVRESGWNMIKIATAFTTLMKQLGYERFAVHGGDMGAGIVGMMSGIASYNLIGTHINSDFFAVAGLGMFPSDPSFLTPDENRWLEQMKQYKNEGTAYLEIQATRPHTIGIALSDSPIGQLAWIVEKYKEWSDEDKNLPEDALDINLLLTNVSIYWFNQAGASSADILAENMHMAFNWGEEHSSENNQWTLPMVPSAIACFGRKRHESLLKKLSSLHGEPTRWAFYDKGCHFPAMEVPNLLVKDIREFYSGILPDA